MSPASNNGSKLLFLLLEELSRDPISMSDLELVFSIVFTLFLNCFKDERSVRLILLIWD